jgi:hypothetical protein
MNFLRIRTCPWHVLRSIALITSCVVSFSACGVFIPPKLGLALQEGKQRAEGWAGLIKAQPTPPKPDPKASADDKKTYNDYIQQLSYCQRKYVDAATAFNGLVASLEFAVINVAATPGTAAQPASAVGDWDKQWNAVSQRIDDFQNCAMAFVKAQQPPDYQPPKELIAPLVNMSDIISAGDVTNIYKAIQDATQQQKDAYIKQLEAVKITPWGGGASQNAGSKDNSLYRAPRQIGIE